MGFIFRPIIGIAVNGGVLYIVSRIAEGMTYTGGIKFFIIGGIVLGILNAFVKPLLKILSLPFMFITGGLFSIVINIFLLWFLKYFIGVLQFQDVSLTFPTFSSYFIAAVVFGLINWGMHLIVK